MSIAMNPDCIMCHLRRNTETARGLGTPEQLDEFTRGLLELYLQVPAGISAVWTGPGTEKLYQRIYGISGDRFAKEKALSNRFVMERIDQIRAKAEAAEDPVYAGLQLAILGNYIDFSALQGEVSFDALEKMLDGAAEIALDKTVYEEFCQDLRKGKRLLYLTDNAGEVVFDRLMGETLQKAYPHLEITYCVRGSAVSNDATRQDAQVAGITFPVIDSGNAIGGTVPRFAGEELKNAIENADVILAKGMGNTESLYGCGYNVYYAFLVKCDRFIQFFEKPKLTPMFIRDKV